jgi:LacI family transcriptional regulator
LKDASIDEDEDLIRQGDYEQSSGYRCTLELMELPDPPTAIIASNDQMAFGAYSAIREMELIIPDDLSLIGFDDVPSSATVYPPLTTVHQPLYEMGRTAVRMVISAIRGE